MQPTAIEQGAAVAPGVHEDFGHLLGLYMRRIRASASGVATEIGLSREAVNNWRNGVSLPNPRSRDRLAACAQYLRLTEAETKDRKSTRLNSSHLVISYAVFCLKKKTNVSCLTLLIA